MRELFIVRELPLLANVVHGMCTTIPPVAIGASSTPNRLLLMPNGRVYEPSRHLRDTMCPSIFQRKRLGEPKRFQRNVQGYLAHKKPPPFMTLP